jgi:23S rRNA (guanosine2251-2'-O)-methyltransferase
MVANFEKRQGRAGRQKPGHGGAPRHGGDADGRPHQRPLGKNPVKKPGPAGQSPRQGPPGHPRPAGKDQRPARRPPAPGRQIEPGLERVFGKHPVEAVLLKRPKAVRRLVIAGRESYYEAIIKDARERNVAVETLPWEDFLALGQFDESEKHQGILALTTPLVIFGDHDLERLGEATCVLALDQVSNPQNLAAILRSASFFHADAVIMMKHRAAEMTAEVQRLAVGGAEFVDLYRITNLANTIDELKSMDFRVFGLDERGERTLAQTEFPKKTVLVIGAEGEGLRQKTRDRCDELVRIPGGRKAVESLNASVATTIGLYEIFRLRD